MSKFLAGIAVAALIAGGIAYGFLPAAQHSVQTAASMARAAMLAAISPAAGEAADAAPTTDQTAMDTMASHKAIYDFRMLGISSGSGGLSDIRGSMYYEQADACEGWTTDHRFTSEYFYPERPSMLNVSQYTAWEAKDGSVFQFNSERQENGEPGEQLRGSVDLHADGSASAAYSRPPDLSFALPAGYYLPVRHTAELVRRARNGDKIFHAVLFDGTDADGPVEVNAVITRQLTPQELAAIALDADGKPNPRIAAGLVAGPAWHVRMAVFPLYPKEGDDTAVPSYEMDMDLHDNGIVSKAVVDYKQFKVAQTLTALEPLPPARCP